MFGRAVSLLTPGKGPAVMLGKDPDPPQALALSAAGNRLAVKAPEGAQVELSGKLTAGSKAGVLR